MPISLKKVRVMIVDDSAVARTIISRGLAADPQIEVVGFAINAMDAMRKIPVLKPDVMTLDVEMPGLSGIDFVKQLLPVSPLPVILVSSLNLRVFDALAAGAVDFVRKPDATQSTDAFLRSLIQKVHVAACAKIHRRPVPTSAPPHPARPLFPPSPPARRHHRTGRFHRRYRGHSGGPQALTG